MGACLKNSEWPATADRLLANNEKRSGFAGFIALLTLTSGFMVSGCMAGLVRVDSPQHVVSDITMRGNGGIRVSAPGDTGAYIIERDGITLDLGNLPVCSIGSTAPDEFVGRCIVVKGARNVTIKKARISGFKVAIYAEDAPGLKIENCDVSNNYRQHLKSTPEKEDESDWLYGHENDNNEWLRYGAGIYLLRCDGATVKNCRARNGQNGICLARCNDASVAGCDMSFMSGWGLAMWRSNRCKVIGNRFDYCVRGYSHGVYARGQDSAGILVYEQCSDNVFAYNHATHGGDGFFLYAGNETVNKTGEGGCNRNLVYMNDFSYAVANGIEATFSDQNIFLQNTLIHCVHGVWAGYSTESLLALNDLGHCQNGVSIEHGRKNRIVRNEFVRCETAVGLWWDEDVGLRKSAYGKRRGCESEQEDVADNHFFWCKTGVRAADTKALSVRGNDFSICDEILAVTGATELSRLIVNKMDVGKIINRSAAPIRGERNKVASAVEFVGDVEMTDSARAREIFQEKYRDVVNQPHPHGWKWSMALATGLPIVQSGPPDRMGTQPLSPLAGVPEGKEHILVTEWGPWDFAGERPKRAATTRPASGK